MKCFLVCSDIKIMGMKRKRKGEKKIKRWKLKDESVRVEFEKSYEKRGGSLMQSNKTQLKKTYEIAWRQVEKYVGKQQDILE